VRLCCAASGEPPPQLLLAGSLPDLPAPDARRSPAPLCGSLLLLLPGWWLAPSPNSQRLMTSLPERGEAPRSDSLCKEDTATAVASSSSSQHKIAAPSTQSPPSYLAPSLPRLPSLRASRTRRRCVRRSHQSPPQDPTFGQGFLGDLWAAAPCGVFSGAPRF